MLRDFCVLMPLRDQSRRSKGGRGERLRVTEGGKRRGGVYKEDTRKGFLAASVFGFARAGQEGCVSRERGAMARACVRARKSGRRRPYSA